MFERTFKISDNILHKDADCTSEPDYTEQPSWLLFMKYLDGLEAERAMAAESEGRPYMYILELACRWATWAAPQGADGKRDNNAEQIKGKFIWHQKSLHEIAS